MTDGSTNPHISQKMNFVCYVDPLARLLCSHVLKCIYIRKGGFRKKVGTFSFSSAVMSIQFSPGTLFSPPIWELN